MIVFSLWSRRTSWLLHHYDNSIKEAWNNTITDVARYAQRENRNNANGNLHNTSNNTDFIKIINSIEDYWKHWPRDNLQEKIGKEFKKCTYVHQVGIHERMGYCRRKRVRRDSFNDVARPCLTHSFSRSSSAVGRWLASNLVQDSKTEIISALAVWPGDYKRSKDRLSR